MSKITTSLIAGAMLLGACTATAQNADNTASADPSAEQATVYFTSEITPQALVDIFQALGVQPQGNVAVKISTGESAKSHHLDPALIKDLVQSVNGTLVECNTLYSGNRGDASTHWKTVKERGYDQIAPFDILDEEGDINIPVNDTTWIKYDIVGSHLPNYDFMINLAHFKGHQMGGFGGVLKNASIGVASASGKAYIHSAGEVTEGWTKTDQDAFLESMASAAQGVHNYFKQPGKDIVYINVMNNMSVDCDCNGAPEDPKINDIGILASTDPVALDQACVDLVFNYTSKEGDDAAPLIERISSRHGTHTIDHAAKLGLGTKNYKIVNLNQ